jgi:hypothetical protein
MDEKDVLDVNALDGDDLDLLSPVSLSTIVEDRGAANKKKPAVNKGLLDAFEDEPLGDDSLLM